MPRTPWKHNKLLESKRTQTAKALMSSALSKQHSVSRQPTHSIRAHSNSASLRMPSTTQTLYKQQLHHLIREEGPNMHNLRNPSRSAARELTETKGKHLRVWLPLLLSYRSPGWVGEEPGNRVPKEVLMSNNVVSNYSITSN